MIVDLHAHYPMHLKQTSHIAPPAAHNTIGDWVRAMVLQIMNRFMNYPKDNKPVVTIENLRDGGVKIALSVLYVPFDEIDLGKPYQAPPASDYFEDLDALIDAVEKTIAQRPGHDAIVAHNQAELAAGQAAGQVVLIHAVEGGFHLGDSDAEVMANVARLRLRGVAYITVAHLFFRDVATNAPALPFMKDGLYHTVFSQPPTGLQHRGETVIRAMKDNNILIDITHMSRRSIDSTLALLDQIDPGRTVPVMATHSACSHGQAEYNISDDHIRAVQQRGGVVGLIACSHWMSDGLIPPKTFDGTMELIHLHIDRIKTVTDSYDYIAIGSDMDGFIKPPLVGLETPVSLGLVEQRLIDAYGDVAAAKICSGNALRVLKYWKGNAP